MAAIDKAGQIHLVRKLLEDFRDVIVYDEFALAKINRAKCFIMIRRIPVCLTAVQIRQRRAVPSILKDHDVAGFAGGDQPCQRIENPRARGLLIEEDGLVLEA